MFIKGLGFGLGFFVAKGIMGIINWMIENHEDIQDWYIYVKKHDLKNCNFNKLWEDYEKEKEIKESKTKDKTIGF